MKKTKPLVLGSVLALLITGGVAQAKAKHYNEDVGAFNGSAYTGYLKQSGLNGTEEIDIFSTKVGGNYTVDMRAQRDSGADRYSKWVRDMGDNESASIKRNYIQSSDAAYRLQISNDLSTPVKVNCYGDFTAW